MKNLAMRQCGQGLVEFAVVFPLILFFLLAIVDIGVAMNNRSTLQHAVREGARFAALSDNSAAARDSVCDRTIAQAQTLLTPSDVTLSYDNLNGGNVGPGDAVDVEADFTYTPLALRSISGLPGLSGLAGWTIPMDVTGSSRLELALASQPGGPLPCL